MGRAVTVAWLRRLHRWVGLVLALPMIVLCLSGFVLATDPLPSPDADGPGPVRTPAQVAAIISAAGRAAPVGLTPRRYGTQADGSSVVGFAPPGAPFVTFQVILDPVTSEVLARGEIGGDFARWVHRLHETLMLGAAGRGIVGWCGIGLLLLGLSGIPLWWPAPGRWKAALTVSPRSSGARLVRQLHGTAGIWALVLLVIQGVSGAALGFPQTARALAGLPPLAVRTAKPTVAVDTPPAIERALTAAREAVPNAALLDLRLPAAPGRPIVAIMMPDGQRDGAPAAFVTLDATTGQALTVQDPRRQNGAAWVLGWLRAAHGGGGLGPVWRLTICCAGLVLPLLPLTGIVMWLSRRRSRRHVARLNHAALAGNER